MSTKIRIQTTETQPFILLPAHVNDKGPFDFVLDTGAAMSIMTEELANSIGIEGTEIKEGLGRILSRYPDQDCRRIDLIIGEKTQWGRGHGTDTIRTLTQWAFEDQGADMIFGCGVADYNPRSRRAFEKAGYVENQRIEEPAGAKAHWSCELALRKEDYFRRQMPNKTAGGDA